MKILLSPAKRLNESHENEWPTSSEPKFLTEAERLMTELKKKSPKQLEKLMHISPDLAILNVERNQKWTSHPDKKESYQAALMFDGEVYRGLRDAKLNADGVNYLQNNMFILSGLYGILHALDRVMPYRLEMGTQLKVGKAKNLHQYWKPILTEYVNQQIQPDELILDLASKEYADSLNFKEIKGKRINVKFMDYKDGKFKQIMVYFKKARGEMASFCAQEQVQDFNGLKQFDRLGYAYDDNLSKGNLLVFSR